MVAQEEIRHYLDRPYRITVVRDDHDSHPWRAFVEELVGCEARGVTAAEAVGQIPGALAEWIEDAYSAGREIPEPWDARDYSGKLLVRMPKSVHRELARSAERDQVSLNAYINALLSSTVAPKEARAKPPAESHDGEADPRQRLLFIAIVANCVLLALATIVGIVLLAS
jgi:predicted HicB family RNase H-like nuclease